MTEQADDGRPRPGTRPPLSHFQLYVLALSVFGALQGLLLFYLFAFPTNVQAFGWLPGLSSDLTGRYVSNDALTRGRLLPMQLVEAGNLEITRYRGVGPEHIVQGRDGYLYTGLCDAGQDGDDEASACRLSGETQGQIVRFHPADPKRIEAYATTGGRPLGMAFDAHNRLYVADARRGLLRITELTNADLTQTPYRVVEQVASCRTRPRPALRGSEVDHEAPSDRRSWQTYEAEEEDRLNFDLADSVVVRRDGAVLFTCPTQRFPLSQVRQEGLEGDATGRILLYQPCTAHEPLTCPTRLVVDGLMFPNGLALNRDETALYVNEWSRFQITKFLLDNNANIIANSREAFFEHAPGYPDNITIGPDGTIWIGLVIRRNPLLDRLRPLPFFVNTLARLPESLIRFTRHAWILGLNEQGRVIHNLQDSSGLFNQVTGAYPIGDALYLGSNTEPAILCVPQPGARNNSCPPARGPAHLAATAMPETMSDSLSAALPSEQAP